MAPAVPGDWSQYPMVPRLALAVVVLSIMAFLLLSYGVLLVFSPEKFLRLHDFINPGSRDSFPNAGWRRDLRNANYKVLGVIFVLSGLGCLGILLLNIGPQLVRALF